MLENRSMPRSTVIPELPYHDVREASAWLCRAYGFTMRLSMGSHRAQLNVGEGAVVLTSIDESSELQSNHVAILIRVADVDGHHEHSVRNGATILSAPADYPYGERQYDTEDFAGNRWTFSQSIADVAPEEWGGVSSSGTSG